MKNMLEVVLWKNRHDFFPVVPFDKEKDHMLPMNFTSSNEAMTPELLQDTGAFSEWVANTISSQSAKYGIGGYRENRVLYKRSPLFDAAEARTLHLGIDIWGPAGTPVFAPLGGMVHSFAFNDNFGDYGATIILQHQLETINFYTLYGHLALNDLGGLRVGQVITRGESFAHFGIAAENGYWPPHLHFQVIIDIGQYEGDYPGVCKVSEAGMYLANSPDPSSLLNFG